MSTTQLVRIQVVLTGDPGTSVTTSGATDPVIHVRTGNVWTYVSDPAVIAAHLETWRLAVREARILFGPHSKCIAPLAGPDGAEVGVILRQNEPQRSTVVRYTPSSNRRSDRYLEVVDGPVLHACRSLAAVEAVHAVWQDAMELSRLVWKPRRVFAHL